MKVRKLYLILALLISLSLTVTNFRTNFAEGTHPVEEIKPSADLPEASLENDQAVILEPDISSTESACPGLSVNYFLIVTNNTAIEETVTFSIEGNDWTTLIDPPTLTLASGEFDYIAVSVQIPWTANGGDQDLVTVTASGQTSGLSDSVILTSIAAIAQGWEDFADSPADRGTRASSVVYWADKIYKIGGFGYIEGVGGARPWLDIYDIATDTWNQGSDMPSGRYWMDCEAIDLTGTDPKIYCGGGYRSSGQSTLYIYDINSDIWSTGASLPESRYNYASVTHNNLYYVIGGLTSTYTNSMLVYDPSSNTWDETKAPMTEARSYFSAGLIGGKIYAAGGYNPDPLSSLEIYDIAANTWSAGADLPTSWLNAADGVIQDRFLVLVGGFENGPTTASNRALVYDAVHESWSRLPIFNHAIYGAEGAGDGEQFWVVSGRLYEDSSFKNSTYTTKMLDCEGGVCIPVTDPNFTWEPLTPAVGTLVTFTATVGGGSPAITYTWDFGDGIPRIGQVVDYIFNPAGTFSVTLTVSNCGGSSTDFITKDVTVLPPESGVTIYLPLIVR
jgi:hypothetical protein